MHMHCEALLPMMPAKISNFLGKTEVQLSFLYQISIGILALVVESNVLNF